MGLKSSRKLLSVLLTVVITFSVCAICVNAVNITMVGNRNFYIKGLSSEEVVADCERQLKSKYDALSVKTNIPSEVFYSVVNRYNTKESICQAVGYLFDENDSKLKNDVREQYFIDVCKEYLDANNIDYDTNAIELACKEALDIYSDTIGIHNLDYFKDSVAYEKSVASKKLSFYLVYVAISIACLCLLYNKKKQERLLHISYALFSSAIACFVAPLLSVIFKSKDIYLNMFEPSVYAKTVTSMSGACDYYLMFAALVVFVMAVASFIVYMEWSHREQFRKDTRFEKIVHKL